MKFSPSPNVAGSTAPWRGFALATGAIVLGLGLVVLIGWGFGLQVLKSLHPAWVSMKPNAALALGDLERARHYATEAAGMLPDLAAARAQLAHVTAREGRLDEATMRRMDRAIQISLGLVPLQRG